MGKITVKATQNAVKHILKEMLFSVKEAQNRLSPDFTLYEEGGYFFSLSPYTPGFLVDIAYSLPSVVHSDFLRWPHL